MNGEAILWPFCWTLGVNDYMALLQLAFLVVDPAGEEEDDTPLYPLQFQYTIQYEYIVNSTLTLLLLCLTA